MSFYRETLVKKPRKEYKCYICGDKIDGEHMYVAGTTQYNDFFRYRAHVECHKKAALMCGNCEEAGYCDMNFIDCFWELVRHETLPQED